MSAYRVACLGWGSLLWDPRTLPMAEGFRAAGPMLPIEFSRVATDGRVTLVIDDSAEPIQTHCVQMDVASLDEAVRELGLREKIAPERIRDWIGVQTRATALQESGGRAEGFHAEIARWLSEQPLDAVVWTALPPRTPDGRLETPSLEALLGHLEGLTGSALSRAEEYIRRAPETVRTPRRRRFEEEFGWSQIP
ncbi:MAG: hypothetical protein GY910_06165 [bacterium]|nr:hypothetical protein [Deltaproteobacteria bacterium]MCP4904546.1 hypothetical protein [bacterium]